MLLERRISHNLALYVPGLLPELDVLVAAIAPRPLTIIAGRRDAIFPAEGVEMVEQKARAAWRAGGAPEAVRFRYTEGGHDLPADALAEALTWLKGVL
jgi:predicted esterase